MTARRLVPPTAVAFDLDGTLVDSREDLAAAANAARAAVDLPPLDVATLAGFVGDGARALVARATSLDGGHGAADARRLALALEAFRAHYARETCVRTRLLPGAEALLDAAGGLPLALVTNKPRDATLAVLRHFGLLERFAFVYAGGDGPLKPAPDGLLAARAALDVSPETGATLWMIGDGPQDVGAARAAGATCLAFVGFAPRGALEEASPDALVDDARAAAALLNDVRANARA